MELPDFIIIPSQVLLDKQLQHLDGKVYGIVYWYSKLKLQKCTASNKTIADLLQASPSGVSNALVRLAKKGYVKIVLDRKTNQRLEIIPLIHFSKPLTQSSNPPLLNPVTPLTQSSNRIRKVNKNNKEEEEEGSLISSKKTNPITLTRGQVNAFLKAFPTLTTSELKEQMTLCNNYMGMSSETIKNPGLFFRKWLKRYCDEKRVAQARKKRLEDSVPKLPDIPEEQRLRNLERIKEIKAKLGLKSILAGGDSHG